MSENTKVKPMPASREVFSLLSVDRVISELRRGRIVVVRGNGGAAALVAAAEAATPEMLDQLEALAKARPELAITARRGAVLNLRVKTADVVILKAPTAFSAEFIHGLSDPISDPPQGKTDAAREAALNAFSKAPAAPFSCECAAVELAKLARLLPAAVTARLSDPQADDLAGWSARHDLLLVDAGDVFQYQRTAARTLSPVSEAKVPLFNATNTRIIAFRPVDGGLEHLAIIIGQPKADEMVLTRIHSECFTGDLLGSLRCDCGDQLQGAIREISRLGSGVLLYLAQEGRGIGLVNKLRAYELQDRGFDTLDANEQLGFDADERIYLPAAQMLHHLGYAKIRLMTNNPAKVEALSQCGVIIVERVPHTFPSNKHNESYLRTKEVRGGHIF